MKVLIAIDSLNEAIGGPAVSIPALADALVDLGATVTVLANNYTGLGPMAALRGSRLVALPARRMPFRMGAWSPGFGRAAWQEIQATDIVHNQGLWLPSTLSTSSVARKLNKPMIVSPRGMLEPWSLNHRALRKSFIWNLAEKKNLQSAAGFHATSQAEAESIRNAGFTQPVAVIPNGVAISNAHPSREVAEVLHPELKNNRWMLFLSRLDEKKGLDLLLPSWAKINAQFPDWQLIIAGGAMDGEQAHFHNITDTLGIGDRTTFTGPVQGELKDCLLSQSDCLVLPSRSENFGNVIVEALAAGTPAIATQGTPWQDLALQDCGWWIPCEMSVLQSTLSKAMTYDSRTLQAMGERGRHLAAQKYTWSAVAGNMQEFYDWILRGMPIPTPAFVIL